MVVDPVGEVLGRPWLSTIVDFTGILEGLRYQIQRGTLGEIRARVMRLLHICQVEMLLIDESHRLRSKALADVQDILDKLQIAILLVGTDRLNASAKTVCPCDGWIDWATGSPIGRSGGAIAPVREGVD